MIAWVKRFHPTARLRLAALLTSLFLIAGMLLLALSYALVRNSLTLAPDGLASQPPALQLGSAIVTARAAGGSSGLSAELMPPDAKAIVPNPGPPPGVSGRSIKPPGAAGPPLVGLVAKGAVQRVQQQLSARTLNHLLVEYLIVLGVLGLLAAGGGWLLAGRVLRPIKRMTKTARAVSQENLSERIAHDGPKDELKELADTFDEMLARLQDSFERQRAFIANASHELRTPLTIIRTEADVALGSADPSAESLLASMRSVRAATARSDRLIGGLLTLARVDSSQRPTTVVELAELAADALRDAESDLAAFELNVNTELEPAAVLGDRRLLETLLRNLIDNAIRYNHRGGELALVTGHDPRAGLTTLSVTNGGDRIPPQRLGNLTQPFQRLARERPTKGAGLGLSIVEAIVAAHHGTLTLRPGDDGGLQVLVELPAARQQRAGHAVGASTADRATALTR
jgi:signal transduction histidine kinase